jgi:chorismate mutase-like protein
MARADEETAKLLAAHRRRIDALDDDIVRLLAERFEVVREVARIKAAHDIPARIPERMEEVRARNSVHGGKSGVDPALVRRLYDQIVDASCALEDELMGRVTNGGEPRD